LQNGDERIQEGLPIFPLTTWATSQRLFNHYEYSDSTFIWKSGFNVQTYTAPRPM